MRTGKPFPVGLSDVLHLAKDLSRSMMYGDETYYNNEKMLVRALKSLHFQEEKYASLHLISGFPSSEEALCALEEQQ